MPWPKEHKLETRTRILDAAAKALRARGVAGTGVAEIMELAGLTHGGFYAHFGSKDQLVAEALEHAGQQVLRALSSSLATAPAGERLHAVVDRYLSQEHVEHPERGCPIAALAPELVRTSPRLRGGLARGIRSRLAWLRSLSPGRGADRAKDDRVAGALACMVGGVILARALGGAEGRSVLRACRMVIRGALSPDSRAPGSSRKTPGPRANRRHESVLGKRRT